MQQSTQCKNCGHTFEGNYCNQCGQSAAVERIHNGFVLRDLHVGLFNLNAGFFYTIKELWLRPGIVVRNFINGKRSRYYYPISMLVVLATIYSFLYHYFEIDIFHLKEHAQETQLYSWLDRHYVYINLVLIPLYSIVSFLVFRKWHYNFYEHMVLNTYSVCQRLVLRIVLIPLILMNPDALTLVIDSNFFIETGLLLWCYIQFFNNGHWLKVSLMAVSVWLLILCCATVTFIIVYYYV